MSNTLISSARLTILFTAFHRRGRCCHDAAVSGGAGIPNDNRSFLAYYTFFIWSCSGLPGPHIIPTSHVPGKTNAQWSRNLGAPGHSRIQNRLHCCEYYSPFLDTTVPQICYARSVLPRMQGDLLSIRKIRAQGSVYNRLLSRSPPDLYYSHLTAVANHVTHCFGKGMKPPQFE
ncbi:hypothetical protein F5J12DRAFT_465516 [Pisolithus orientalis]|uniref:uncharacterized protein n=1 Tax=Pisolithus orientalis TaxID=936130 RepID=UPI0022245560|nr:uncharacterized protein F5J12DRAFT_465516 [Pisolithus orientalis]KAI5991747.1 hypothetical protein F5J12DRAFT_465516 [Pisolithus orientalis]